METTVSFSEDGIANLDEIFDGIEWTHWTSSYTRFWRETIVFVLKSDSVIIGTELYWGKMAIRQNKCGGMTDLKCPTRIETRLAPIPESFYITAGRKNEYRELIYGSTSST